MILKKKWTIKKIVLFCQESIYEIFATITTFYARLVIILLLYWRIFEENRLDTPEEKASGKIDEIFHCIQKYTFLAKFSLCNSDLEENSVMKKNVHCQPKIKLPDLCNQNEILRSTCDHFTPALENLYENPHCLFTKLNHKRMNQFNFFLSRLFRAW